MSNPGPPSGRTLKTKKSIDVVLAARELRKGPYAAYSSAARPSTSSAGSNSQDMLYQQDISSPNGPQFQLSLDPTVTTVVSRSSADNPGFLTHPTGIPSDASRRDVLPLSSPPGAPSPHTHPLLSKPVARKERIRGPLGSWRLQTSAQSNSRITQARLLAHRLRTNDEQNSQESWPLDNRVSIVNMSQVFSHGLRQREMLARRLAVEQHEIRDWGFYLQSYAEGSFSNSMPPKPPRHNSTFTYLPGIYPTNEADRLQAVKLAVRCNTEQSRVQAQQLVDLAMSVFQVRWASLSFFDRDFEIMKAEHGWDVSKIRREASVGAHVLLKMEPMIIKDLTEDWRFAKNPIVLEQAIRFYAGAPIILSNGHIVGVLAVFDEAPRTNFTISFREQLVDYSKLAGIDIQHALDDYQPPLQLSDSRHSHHSDHSNDSGVVMVAPRAEPQTITPLVIKDDDSDEDNTIDGRAGPVFGANNGRLVGIRGNHADFPPETSRETQNDEISVGLQNINLESNAHQSTLSDIHEDAEHEEATNFSSDGPTVVGNNDTPPVSDNGLLGPAKNPPYPRPASPMSDYSNGNHELDEDLLVSNNVPTPPQTPAETSALSVQEHILQEPRPTTIYDDLVQDPGRSLSSDDEQASVQPTRVSQDCTSFADAYLNLRLIAETLQYDLSYVIRVSGTLLQSTQRPTYAVDGSTRILISVGMPTVPPTFDALLHLRALNSSSGIVYCNSNNSDAPRDTVGYCAGVLIPIHRESKSSDHPGSAPNTRRVGRWTRGIVLCAFRRLPRASPVTSSEEVDDLKLRSAVLKHMFAEAYPPADDIEWEDIADDPLI